MISFLLCLAILIGGYFVYGKIVDNTFGPDDRETPAVRINDGVDYVVLSHGTSLHVSAHIDLRNLKALVLQHADDRDYVWMNLTP